jgi:hypothetical protein
MFAFAYLIHAIEIQLVMGAKTNRPNMPEPDDLSNPPKVESSQCSLKLLQNHDLKRFFAVSNAKQPFDYSLSWLAYITMPTHNEVLIRKYFHLITL